MMKQTKYGLITAICMITGIVIGSGIFFKADDILLYTKGNMLLGILIFCVASFAIVFGSLTVSQLAMKTDKSGGIIAYAEEFINKETACAFGWFQLFLYLPSLIAVVSWVAGMYLCQLFGIAGSNKTWSIIGFFVMIVLFIMNMLSKRLGGLFQNASMFIKLIPLIVMAVVGFIWGKPESILSHDISTVRTSMKGLGFLTAFAPIAFSFDGWIVSTSISHEIKNSRKNLPLALTIAPFIVLIAYIAYFVGITSLIGTDAVLAHGNDSVYVASNLLFGAVGAKIVLVFIVISVLGTINGLILGFIRLPSSMAARGMLPFAEKLKDEDSPSAFYHSSLFAFIISLVWCMLHFVTQEIGMNGDVSEIAICVSYLNYIILYITVMKMAKRGEIKGFWKGYVIPVLASVGSLIIFSGSVTNPMFPLYLVICYSIMAGAFFYQKKNPNRDNVVCE